MAEGESLVSIKERLLKERHALLDLSTRNRLLNIPLRTRNIRAIEIVDEKAAEIFRLLSEGKSLTFQPGVQLTPEERAALDPDDRDTGGIPQPGDDARDAKGRAARHLDTKLQTRLTSEGLQKRLFDIWYDAQTLEQEQGVNILYLAIGLVRWYDAEASETARHAPLVLLPVQLERSSAADKFKLKGRDEPPSPNLTLQAKMKADFGIVIDDFSDEDAVDLPAYAAKVAETLSSHTRWEVLPDAMVLGFFSFSKFLMYRDLDPENWPDGDGIEDNSLITAILRDGFPDSEPIVHDNERIDDKLPPVQQNHVVDADSSQTVAIAEVVAGRTLVIKGPPGTGKSQTITNIIAGAVAAGKKVLFVAEKMAALDVVHRRLKAAGLGPLALELHSNKISKRSVLEELKRTKETTAKAPRGDLTVIQKLDDTTETLNDFAERLHMPLQPSGLTPQHILGRLARWDSDGEPGRGYDLTGAETWTAEDVAKRRGLAEEMTERLNAIGPVPQHPWRGVRADAFDPSQRDRLMREIAKARENLLIARAQADIPAVLFGAPKGEQLADLYLALDYLRLTPLPRDADRAAFADIAWQNPKAITAVIEAGARLARLRVTAAPVFNEAGLTADYAAIRTAVVTKSGNLFRFLDGDYKRNIALLRSYVKGMLPKDPDGRLKLIDQAMTLQRAEATFAGLEAAGRAFGRLWQGADSAWESLDNILKWRLSHTTLHPDAWLKLAVLSDTQLVEADRARQTLYAALSESKSAMDHILAALDIDLDKAFGQPDEGSLQALIDRLSAWLGDMESLSRFIALASRGRALAALGAGQIVDDVHNGTLGHTTLLSAFDGAYCVVLRDALFATWPDLKAFDGDSHDRLISQFRQLDRTRIELAKEQIAAQHADDRPQGAGGVGPLGVLNAELAKKRSHKPIRVLLEQAGPAIQELKPVFMMSPLSVAQFLKPGGLKFDLLVMDEASQIEPVDALGAIARVKQLAVVGDERQLPPTAFFKKLTGEDEPEANDDLLTIQAKDAESILDLCLAKGAPHRMLNWHYRSKHQSLIAVSNREFYENRLFIVPSPYDAVAGMGLKFHWLKDTAYDRGNTRTNPKEARIVAEAVLAHARQNPDQSLGVATFSVSQRQCILKELELLRRANPEVEDFFATNSAEPFFVKNLENIQGDERDVIFISVGYGKTEQGYLAHAFGPLSGEGGERRLNVLISRAKLRCEVFSNFTGADIDPERTQARGVLALKLFLTFAETGRFDAGDNGGGDHDSVFETQVCEKLRGLGYDVKTQIGASGFRVDLAVADPEKPGRFVLGIECDGAQYHSSRSARDRDRLRQQVLEAHGWIIHRIWSADWYLRPKEELKKVEAAVAEARKDWRERDDQSYRPAKAVPLAFETSEIPDATVITPVMQTEPKDGAGNLYQEAAFHVNTSVEPHLVSLSEMAGHSEKIVAQEGPIHIDEIAARIRGLWGLQRAGARIRAAVTAALRVCLERGMVVAEGDFYSAPDQAVTARDRSQVASASLRKPDMLPPREIDQALIQVISDNYGASRAELVQAAARLFGFAATSAALKARLEERVNGLEAGGVLIEKGGLMVLA